VPMRRQKERLREERGHSIEVRNGNRKKDVKRRETRKMIGTTREIRMVTSQLYLCSLQETLY